MTLTLADIDLLEDTWARAVPYDQFERLRRDAPVYWHEHPDAEGFWAVTRYDDVRASAATTRRSRPSSVRRSSGSDARGARDDPHDDPQHGPAEALALPPAGERRVHAADDRPAHRSHPGAGVGDRRQRRGTRRDRVRRGGRRRAAAADDLRDDRRPRRGPAPDLRLEQPARRLPGRGVPHVGGRRPDRRGRDLRILRGDRRRSSPERPRRHHDGVGHRRGRRRPAHARTRSTCSSSRSPSPATRPPAT